MNNMQGQTAALQSLRVAAAAICVTALHGGAAAAQDIPADYGCNPDRYPTPPMLSKVNVAYMKAFGQEYHLDLAGPETEERLPLAVLVHGGGFTGGTRCAMNEIMSLYAERGFRAATISYPLCADYVLDGEPLLAWDAEEARIAPDPPGIKNKAPCAAQADSPDEIPIMPSPIPPARAIRAAIKYLHDHAKQYGIDTSQTVCHGASAGAYACTHAEAYNTTGMEALYTADIFGADVALDEVSISVVVAMTGGLFVGKNLTREHADAMSPGGALYNIVDYKDSSPINHCTFLPGEIAKRQPRTATALPVCSRSLNPPLRTCLPALPCPQTPMRCIL